MHTALLTWARQYGAVYKMFLGSHAIVVVTGGCTHVPCIETCPLRALTRCNALPPSVLHSSVSSLCHGNQHRSRAWRADADMVQQICVKDFQTFPGRFYSEVSGALPAMQVPWASTHKFPAEITQPASACDVGICNPHHARLSLPSAIV